MSNPSKFGIQAEDVVTTFLVWKESMKNREWQALYNKSSDYLADMIDDLEKLSNLSEVAKHC